MFSINSYSLSIKSDYYIDIFQLSIFTSCLLKDNNKDNVYLLEAVNSC